MWYQEKIRGIKLMSAFGITLMSEKRGILFRSQKPTSLVLRPHVPRPKDRLANCESM